MMSEPYCDKHNEVVERSARLEGKMDVLLMAHGIKDPNKAIANNPHPEEGKDYVKIQLLGRSAKEFIKWILLLMCTSSVIALFGRVAGVW